MKRKFVKVMFFGALALSTVTYVGCKDYDDDISNLQTQIDANKASIADLKKFVDEGKWVKSVEDVAGGFKITFNDGKTYSIVNGAKGDTGATGSTGAAGSQGTPGTKVEMKDGFWYIDGVNTNVPVNVKGDKGEQGDQGEQGPEGPQGPAGDNGADGNDGNDGADGKDGIDGKSPQIIDGYWYFYSPENAGAITDGDLKGWVKSYAAESSIYVVKSVDMPNWVLNVQDQATGEWQKVVLPCADDLTSIKGVAIDGGLISVNGTKEITLFYGVVNNADGVTFDGVTYAKGEMLTSNSAVINAMVNPSDIDLSQYTIGLQDSHGNTCYSLTAPEKNMSSDPLVYTRAEQWNKGIYNLTVSFAEGVDIADIKPNVAYAMATKNAWGQEILSAYDVKVKPDNTTSPALTAAYSIDVPFNQVSNLAEIVVGAGETNLGNVAAYYFEFTNLPATVTFDKEKNTINSTVGQTINGTLHYLKVNGDKGTTALTLNFKSVPNAVTVADINWIIGTTAADAKVALPAEIKNLLDDATGNYSLIYATGIDFVTPGANDIKFTSTEPVMVDGNTVTYNSGSISLALTHNNKAGAEKVYYLTPSFNNATVTATGHTVKLVVKDRTGVPALGTDIVRTINLKVNVAQDDSKIFAFNPLTAYFDPAFKNASAYGTPDAANDVVAYDLYSLFNEITGADKANITFTEEKDGTWLTDATTSTVKVPYADVKKLHSLEIAYQPFANTNLAKIKYPFTLKIKSEIAEGTHGTVADKFLSLAKSTFDLKQTELKWKDYKNGDVLLGTDTRVELVTLELSPEAAKYMTLDNKDFKANATIKVSLKSNITIIETEIPGATSFITMSVTDTWGVVSTVKIPVPIKK